MTKKRKPTIADTLAAATDPVAAVEAERKALAQRVEIEKLRRSNAELHRLLGLAEQRNQALIELANRPKVRAGRPPVRKAHATSHATAILVLSDWHVEERVEADKVAGMNSFDLAEAAKRIERTFDKALLLLDDARQLARIDEMVVAVLGDLCSGYIHEELVEGNQLAPLPALRFAQEHLTAGIDRLLAHGNLSSIVIPTCYGNHGRTTQKVRVSTGAENSFEQNLYYTMAHHYLPDPRVRWKIEPGYHNWLTVQGHAIRLHHGDAIKYAGGIGGIGVPVNRAIAQWDRARKADLDIFGHWHQFHWSGKWICNGSLIGYSPYAVRIKAEFEHPRQTFAVVDRKWGVTRALPIFCGA